MSITKERFFNEFKKDQATYDEIHENILDGVNIGGANFIILMCAIIIASVGLNMNATAVIIGAMLISPLMGPIIAIGYSVGIYNLKLLKKICNYTNNRNIHKYNYCHYLFFFKSNIQCRK